MVVVGSTGVPAVEPLVAVTRGGRTAFHARCTPEWLERITSGLDEDADAVDATGEADAVVDHDPETTRLPTSELPGLSTGVRAVLGACG